jgi:sugar lactone lactonase YvrE
MKIAADRYGHNRAVELVASGYALAEAPVAAPDGGVYFSDALSGGVYNLSPTSGAVETVVAKRRGVGGMALHADGGLVMSGRDVVHVRDGESRTLYSNPELPGLNDLTVDPDGQVIAGTMRFRPFAGDTPVAGEFIRLDGSVVLPNVLWPNGCAFSPDGRTFYGCDYQRGRVLAADRQGDHQYGPPRIAVISPSGAVDGMAVDEDGCLWIALGARASIGRFTPAGHLDIEMPIDADFAASLGFAGADRKDLYITTTGNPSDPASRGGVFLTHSSVAGLRIPPVTQ